jgi:creatinine amidohydrolase
MGVHGGHGETSLMLHLRPELVHMEHARRRVPDGLLDFEHIGFGKPVSFGWTSADFGPDGHIGDPTGATAEHGKAIFEAAVGRLAEVIVEAHRFTTPA